MKKRIFAVIAIAALSVTLAGCSGLQELTYKDKVRSVDQVEEMLEDLLESENPELDLDIEITEDTGE